MKKIILLTGCLFSLATAQAQTFGWANRLGSTSNDMCRDVATDAAGNVYTTGYFQGTVDFDPGAGTANLTSAGGLDIYISKLDAAGNYVWALKIGGTTGDEANGIALDPSGNIYLTGYFHGTVDFDPGAGVSTLGNGAGADVFVLKLNSAGGFVWVRQIGGNSDDHQGNRITADASGNVYTTGKFVGILDFDPGAGVANLGAISSTNPQYFVQKLNSSGNYVWAKYLGNGGAGIYGFDIEVNSTGDVYTCGYFTGGWIDFDPSAGSAVYTAQGIDIFINKWSSAGNYVWAKWIGNTSNDEALGLALDGSGNVYSTGFFNGTVDFDPGVGVQALVSAGAGDVYVNKLDPSGNFVWAKRIGGTLDDYGYALCVDATGAVYSTGFYTGTADFDPGASTANNTAVNLRDAYISKLDASGNYAWGFSIGGTGIETGYGIAVTSGGSVYTSGYFAGPGDFDPTAGTANLTTLGANEIFIQKMVQCLTPGAPTNTTSAPSMSICYGNATTLSATGYGTLGWYTASSGGTYLGAGTNYTTGNLTTSTTYYVQDSLCASGTRTAITVTVNPLLASTVSSPSQSNILCNGDATGSATIGASGGTGAFTYLWSPSGGTAATASALTAAIYTCTVTDANNCTQTQTVNITEPTAIVSTLITSSNISCFGMNDGSADVVASGGTGALAFAWTPTGGNAGSASGLSAGTYTCTVTDQNGCTDSQTVTIIEPAVLASTIASQTDPTCFGSNDGSASLNVTGGTGIISYVWMPFGGNSSSASGLTAGTYTVLINDQENCQTTQSVTLTEPAAIDVTTALNGNMLSSNQNGASYQWIDCLNGNAPVAGETNQSFTPQLNGDYAVIVTVGPCSDTSACTNVITGIENQTTIDFNVYPNPTSGDITIQMSNSSHAQVDIFNTLGQLVRSENLLRNTTTLELPEENGIYLVRVTIDGVSSTKRVIRQ